MADKLTWEQVRKKTGMKSAEMAEHLGLSRQLYQMKETYKRVMRVEEAVEIARLAKVDLKDIVLK